MINNIFMLKKQVKNCCIFLFLISLASCGLFENMDTTYNPSRKPSTRKPRPASTTGTSGKVVKVLNGKASYYADKFDGRKTASGEVFRQSKLTAAHKTLPFGTVVKVTNLNNKKSVIVKINDRGPFVKGRIIDLSKKAALAIDMVRSGVVPVKVEVLK